jgi:glycosyltransferase involved in cell wall biosynthesis
MDFTIVTASYNYGHYINDCLQSVASQEDVEFEHLIMDACSTDDTAEIVASYPHASLYQERDKGMTDGLNKGFRKAKGKWVMWLNADDRLKPGALKAVKNFAESNPAADVIYGGWDYMDASGIVSRRMHALPFDFRILVQHGCYIGSTACFFRRETTIAQGHLLNDDFGYCMDGEYYARLSSLSKRFMRMSIIVADFRLHDESISQKSLGKTDMGNILRMQRQLAEPRAIRRIYGFKPFKDENLSLIVDGCLYHSYRIKKALVKLLYNT